MKKIQTLIEPCELTQITENLKAIGIPTVNITEIKLYSSQDTVIERYRGTHYLKEYTSKLNIEVFSNSQKNFNEILDILQNSKSNKPITVITIEENIEISKNYFETFMNEIL